MKHEISVKYAEILFRESLADVAMNSTNDFIALEDLLDRMCNTVIEAEVKVEVKVEEGSAVLTERELDTREEDELFDLYMEERFLEETSENYCVHAEHDHRHQQGG